MGSSHYCAILYLHFHLFNPLSVINFASFDSDIVTRMCYSCWYDQFSHTLALCVVFYNFIFISFSLIVLFIFFSLLCFSFSFLVFFFHFLFSSLLCFSFSFLFFAFHFLFSSLLFIFFFLLCFSFSFLFSSVLFIVMFQEEGKIPKAMVKYASGISLESIGTLEDRTISLIGIVPKD